MADPDRLPDCIIVSSDRFSDIGPYASRVYDKFPQVWGSIFPWEFPQNAGKEEEENFLRRFFSETEIHMQGGAHGEGRGFRFLKQVWYCNALWNLEHRIPAVANWFWEQPVNMSNLHDPELRKFFFAPGVQPSTFFEAPELNIYGEKFLSYVIPFIQKMARDLIDEKEPQKEAEKDDRATTVQEAETRKESIASGGDMAPTAPYSPSVEANSGQPVQSTELAGLPAQMSQEAPPQSLPGAHHPHPYVQGNDDTGPQGQLPNQRKRGFSIGKRFNGRGGQFQGRQPNPFYERNSQQYASPQFGPPPMPVYNQNRATSGGALEFMPAGPQGPQMLTTQNAMQPIPPQFAKAGPMPHPGSFTPGHGPVYYSNNSFNERNPGHFPDRSFSGEVYPPQNDGFFNKGRGNQRRNSQGGRGRGFINSRGRGGRGRNSFTAADMPQFVPPGEFNGWNPPPQDRRSGSYEEGNWRSGSDRPQTEPGMPAMKENMMPNQPFSGPIHQQMPPPMTYNDLKGNMAQFYGNNQGRGPPMDPGMFNNPGPPREMKPYKRPQGNPMERGTCGHDWIAPECTIVEKLVAFDVPEDIPEGKLANIFRQWGKVTQVDRQKFVPQYGAPAARQGKGTPAVFIGFENSVDARDFLHQKPAEWLNGRPLLVVVPKQYWDDGHKSFQRRIGGYVGPPGARGREDTFTTSDKSDTQAPVILHRKNQDGAPRNFSLERKAGGETKSGETTPTPSGANTPKKHKTNKKSGQKKKENEASFRKENGADSRKASEAASVEQNTGTQRDDSSDTSSVKTTANTEPGAHEDGVVEADKQLAPSITATVNDGTKAEEAQLRTTSDSVAENVKSQLPDMKINKNGEPSNEEVGERETEMSSTAKAVPASTGTSAPERPLTSEGDSQNFRDEAAQDTKKTQAVVVDTATQGAHGEGSGQADKAEATPTKLEEDQVDESFHTASGSPGSVHTAGLDKPRFSDIVTSVEKGSTESPLPEKPDAEQVVGPERSTSPSPSETTPNIDENKAVDETSVTSKPKVTISTAPADEGSDESQLGQRSSSGNTIVPPTPAFVTAPNTPAILQDTTKDQAATEEGAGDEGAKSTAKKPGKPEKAEKSDTVEKADKSDKAKGPAQTESLSLFGKKKEKKSKSGKKGTIKGKPPTGDVTSASSSRAVSGATTHIIQGSQGACTVSGSKTGGEEMRRDDSKTSTHTPQGPQESSKDSDAKSAPLASVEVPQASQQDTPSKRRGKLGNLLSGIFGGGQQTQALAREAKSNEAAPPKTMLTSSKVPNQSQNIETKGCDAENENESTKSDESAITASGLGGSAEIPSGHLDSSAQVAPFTGDEEASVVGEIGLGISSFAIPQPVDQGTTKSKKKKKKPRKSNNFTAEDEEGETEQTSSLDESKLPGMMFRFGENSSVPNPLRDDRSGASTPTEVGDTGSSEPLSPTSSAPARKLPPTPTTTSHLVAAKQPTWKNKKRVTTGKASEPMTELTTDVTYSTLPSADNYDTSEQTSVSGKTTPSSDDGTRPRRVLVYVGGNATDQGQEEGLPSTEWLQEKAMEALLLNNEQATAAASTQSSE